MTVLDAYTVLAFLMGEAAAHEVRTLLDQEPSSLTALGVAEVFDHLVRVAGVDEEDAVLDLARLGLVDGRTVDASLGMAGGRLRARHYDRRHCQVSMADCVAAEAARAADEPLATADHHLLDVCHAEGIDVVDPDPPGRAGHRLGREVVPGGCRRRRFLRAEAPIGAGGRGDATP